MSPSSDSTPRPELAADSVRAKRWGGRRLPYARSRLTAPLLSALPLLGGGRRDGGRRGAVAEALLLHRCLDALARLVNAPLDRGDGDLERVRDLDIGEADDVAQ